MMKMKQVTPHELKKWTTHGKDFLLVDIREGWERDQYHIGGVHIPMGELIGRVREIPKDRHTVIYCERGIRSVIAVQRLEASGYDNLYNLAGGVKAWQDEQWSPS
jgi:adenylyltransferase/sulfurtransferase